MTLKVVNVCVAWKNKDSFGGQNTSKNENRVSQEWYITMYNFQGQDILQKSLWHVQKNLNSQKSIIE